MPENDPKATQEEQQSKSKLPIKTIIVIVGVLLLEAATVFVVKMTSGGPAPAEATEPIAATEDAPSKDMAEITLCDNMQVDNWVGGRARTIVTLEVVIKTDKTNEAALTQQVTDNSTEIKDRIRVLVGSAQPDHIRDPQLQVIKREIKMAMTDILDELMINEILIPTWQSFTQD